MTTAAPSVMLYQKAAYTWDAGDLANLKLDESYHVVDDTVQETQLKELASSTDFLDLNSSEPARIFAEGTGSKLSFSSATEGGKRDYAGAIYPRTQDLRLNIHCGCATLDHAPVTVCNCTANATNDDSPFPSLSLLDVSLLQIACETAEVVAPSSDSSVTSTDWQLIL